MRGRLKSSHCIDHFPQKKINKEEDSANGKMSKENDDRESENEKHEN